MPEDRLQLPESLEKAIEYLKQEPTEYAVAKKRALLWEQIATRGRRSLFWWRWRKPLSAALAGVVVLLAAILIPQHLGGQNGSAQWGNASSPTDTSRTIKVLPTSDTVEKTRFYAQEGKRYLYHDFSTDYDLVERVDTSKQIRELYLARNGVEHKVFEITAGLKFQPIQWQISPLIGFQLIDANNSLDQQGSSELYLFLINTDTMKVTNVPLRDGRLSQVAVWDRRPNHMTVLFAEINSQTYTEKVQSWEWNEQGAGTQKTIYSSANDYLRAIQVHGTHLLLWYPHQLLEWTDHGVRTIEAKTNVTLSVFGDQADEASGLLYTDGELPSPQFGTYKGNVRLKWYNYQTGQSQVVLPNAGGDQTPIINGPHQEVLLEAFQADQPDTASKQALGDVPGMLQLWYWKIGSEPVCVYQERMKGEHFLYPYVGSGQANLNFMQKLNLVQNPAEPGQKSALQFDWQTKIAQPVTLQNH